MEQKNKIVARLQQQFGGSSLPGAVTRVQVMAGETQGKTGVEVVDGIVARLAHLDPAVRGQIEELLAIEGRLQLRCFVTADQCRAGIIIPDAVRKNHWPEFLRYSGLFFGPAHEAICTVFKKELQAVARHHGKNQISEEGSYTIPAEVLGRLARQKEKA